MVDDSGVIYEIDDLEEVTGLRRVDTSDDKEAGDVRTTKEEEEADIELKLVERVAQRWHAASLEMSVGEEQDAGDMQLVYHRHAVSDSLIRCSLQELGSLKQRM